MFAPARSRQMQKRRHRAAGSGDGSVKGRERAALRGWPHRPRRPRFGDSATRAVRSGVAYPLEAAGTRPGARPFAAVLGGRFRPESGLALASTSTRRHTVN